MPPKVDHKAIRINNRIRVPEIRLIGATGEQLGIVSVKEGIERAQEQGLDLVEVSPAAKPPVCRILDFGKYLYDIGKKEKESRKKQKNVTVKEVKVSPKIGDHDFQTKLRNARRFIERGDKVKLTMFFRGREITHAEVGQRVIERFLEEIDDVAEVERNEGLAGRSMCVYLTPSTSKSKKKPAQEKLDSESKGQENAKVENE